MNKKVGIFTLRMVLGLVFFMQGFGKVFKFGVNNVYNNFFKESYTGVLPDFLLQFTAYYTSYVELIFGFLLIIGFKRNISLYFLASVLIIISFGHGLIEPIWDMSHMFYRLAMLVPLLLLPESWDEYSFDNLIKKKVK